MCRAATGSAVRRLSEYIPLAQLIGRRSETHDTGLRKYNSTLNEYLIIP